MISSEDWKSSPIATTHTSKEGISMGGKAVFVHAVGDQRIVYLGAEPRCDLFVFVDDHHLVAHVQKVFSERLPEFAHADE